MWFLEAILTGFTVNSPALLMQLVQVGVGLAALVKSLVAFHGGGWNRFRLGGLERAEVIASLSAGMARLVVFAYRPALVVRLVASITLLIGVFPRISAAILIACFLLGFSYEQRYNTIFICLTLIALVLTGAPLRFFEFSMKMSSDNTFPQFLIGLFLINLYWNSAWQKMRSAQFVSGLLLQQNWLFLSHLTARRPTRGHLPANNVSARIPAIKEQRFWRVAAVAAVALEWVLPVGLLIPATYWIAVALGLAMHIGFTLLMPYRLLSFSFATVTCYVVFWPGHT